MSPTLDVLYDDFLNLSGNLTVFPWEGTVGSPADDKYVVKKVDSIRRCLKKMSHPDETIPFYYPEVWKSFWDEMTSNDMTYMSDPLLSLLLVRTGDLAVVTPGLGSLYANQMKENIDRFLSSASLSGLRLHNNFVSTFGKPEDVHLHWCLLQIRAYFQYTKFRFMNQKNDQESMEVSTVTWEKYQLANFWDYSKVHPFLRELCPPGHIWGRYLLDGNVCSLNANGTVTKREPVGDELKTQPPVLLWNEESGRRTKA